MPHGDWLIAGLAGTISIATSKGGISLRDNFLNSPLDGASLVPFKCTGQKVNSLHTTDA